LEGIIAMARSFFAWIGVIAVLGVAGTAFWFGNQARSMPAKQAWDATVVIDRILPAAKMITVEASTTQQMSVRDDFFDRKFIPGLIGRQILIGQAATLNIGYDLMEWDARDEVRVNLLSKVVSVNLPEPKLLIVAPDASSKSIYVQSGLFRNSDLTPEESVKIDQTLHAKFVQAAEVDDLKVRARSQIHRFLEELFRPHGYDVRVTFDGVAYTGNTISDKY